MNVYKNLAKRQFRGVVIGIAFLIPFIIKKVLSFGMINSKKNYFDFSMGVSVIAPIIALKKVLRYFMASAIKKD